ncbi:MAG TPA: DUF2505 domain-containing protein [Kofleriaceae bacterium]
MPTAFAYEHVFRVASTERILSAYFDPDHLATQDKLAELGDRTVVENEETDAIRKTTWRVQSLKPLPMFVRPFVQGGRLSYLEQMTWRKADDAIDLVVTPEILGGRVSITAIYELTKIDEGQVRRKYAGQIAVNIRLLSGKIERGIREKFDETMQMMTDCTQGWLDRTARLPET